jgi:ABC-type polysaccharide/polyol phosphate export permease
LLFSFVFRFFLRVDPEVGDPSGVDNFALFLMCGLLPFNFLANTMTGGMGTLIGNANLVKKTYFPREILVAANTASWLVSFLIELTLLAVVFLFFGNVVFLWLPAILVLIVLQTMFVLGLALLLSSASVYFRDLEHLVGIVLQAWLYTAPIVYPMKLVADQLGEDSWGFFLYNLNPLTRFVEAYRDFFYSLRWPPVDEIAYLVVVSTVTLLLGYWVFGRLEGRFAEEL